MWGAYHGALLVAVRAWSSPIDAAREAGGSFRVAGMFVLTCIGWLIFRETELDQLWRDLRLSPWRRRRLAAIAGLYLFLLAGLYSLPLWIHDLWAEFGGPSLVPRR